MAMKVTTDAGVVFGGYGYVMDNCRAHDARRKLMDLPRTNQIQIQRRHARELPQITKSSGRNRLPTNLIAPCPPSSRPAYAFRRARARANPAYGPGVTDTEIKPGSRRRSADRPASQALAAQCSAIFPDGQRSRRRQRGRKIAFTQLDNAFSRRRLSSNRAPVEEIGVLAEVGDRHSAERGDPEISELQTECRSSSLAAGGRRFNDPKNFPWTVPLYPDFETEGAVVAKISSEPSGCEDRRTVPERRLRQGLRARSEDGLKPGRRRSLSKRATNWIGSDDRPVIPKLKAAGIDTLIEQSAAKTASVDPQGFRTRLEAAASSAVRRLRSRRCCVLPGSEASKGLVLQFLKQPGDPAWANDAEVKAYKEFLAKYAPSVHADDYSALVAYVNVNALGLLLKRRPATISRAKNLIKVATSMAGQAPLMLPGVALGFKPDDYTPYGTLRMAEFDGVSWNIIGDPLTAGP